MNKTILSTLLLLSFLLVLTAFGAPQAEQGEINEISYGTFIKFLDDENSKPFFFIATDEKEDTFNQETKPIYEDYLTEQGTGAFYLNLHKISDEKIDELNNKIDELNNKIAAKYVDEIDQSYDVRDDYMLIIKDDKIQNINTKHAALTDF